MNNEQVIEETLNKMEQVRAMGPKTRYKMKQLLAELADLIVGLT